MIRPQQILKEIGRKYPQAWQQVKLFRAGKGKTLPDWPDWCYIPLAAGMAIVTQDDNSKIYEAILSPLSPAVITAAAAWRVTQGVYRFDADLYNSLVSQPMDGNIPCEALKRLPEWCVYIETINAKFLDQPIVGFWAHLEKDMNDGREELRLVLMAEDGFNIPVAIYLGDWTLDEGLRRMHKEAERQTGLNFPVIDYASDITPLVQLVLYLCAENADIPTRPVHPNTRVRQSGQVDVAREVRTWNVGIRVGASIRRYRNEEMQREREIRDDEQTEQRTRESPRPHIRRAHWHHYWIGPKDGKRELILHWLPPIPVRIDGDMEENLPVVIHKVKK